MELGALRFAFAILNIKLNNLKKKIINILKVRKRGMLL
jgi:hypothetical protein